MLNEIENKFLTEQDKKNKKKILLLHGDYSRTSQMKGCIPSPNIGFKKILNKRFDIVEINEYNTSKLYNKTLKELINVSIRKNKYKRYLHEILTLKEEPLLKASRRLVPSEPERCIYVNRDKNACKNILNIGKEYLETQTRKKEFTREKKKKDKLINKKDKKIVKLKKVIVV